jgi:hypothetical protein
MKLEQAFITDVRFVSTAEAKHNFFGVTVHFCAALWTFHLAQNSSRETLRQSNVTCSRP